MSNTTSRRIPVWRELLRPAWAKERAARAGALLRGVILAAGLAGLTSLSLSFGATAQDNDKNGSMADMPPMPPARPATLSATSPHMQAPAIVLPPGEDPMVADFAADLPEDLPRASRAQMHKCGREWQEMKASGAAADKTWFSFARICLVR